MTALAGVLDRSEADQTSVSVMLAAMGHRGPSARVTRRSGPVWMGAGHLAGRPADGLHSDSPGGIGDSWMICAESRLDNLEALSGRFSGFRQTSAEILLQAYRHWGAGIVDHLQGDFAFAVWDSDRHRLFFARDRFGVMPFYYVEQPGRFAFASEAKGLLALPTTPRRVPKIRLAEFLGGHCPPEDESFFADIRRLPAGAYGFAGEGMFRTRRYWSLALPERVQAADPASEFRELFDQAVRRRLPEERPVVSMLSGGLDSSSISAVAENAVRGRAQSPLSTVSMVFPERAEGDEQIFIDALLATGKYAPELIAVRTFDPFAGFQDSLRVQDGLVLAPGLLLNRDLYRNVPAGGVMLSGHGGDEVVSQGFGYLHNLGRARDWPRLWRACGGAADVYRTSQRALFWSFYERYGPGRYKIRAVQKALRRSRSTGGTQGWISKALAETYREELRLRSAIPRTTGSGRALDLNTLADPLQAHALEILDRESADAGIESRYPFWDMDLVRFSLSLDPGTKLKDGWTRMLLREAMAEILPDMIRWRRDKHDFSPVIVEGLLTSPAASRDRLAAKRGRLSEYVDLGQIEAARDRLLAARTGLMNPDAQALWRTAALAEWLDYSDQQGIDIL